MPQRDSLTRDCNLNDPLRMRIGALGNCMVIARLHLAKPLLIYSAVGDDESERGGGHCLVAILLIYQYMQSSFN